MKSTNYSAIALKTNYTVSGLIAKKFKPYSGSRYEKEYLQMVGGTPPKFIISHISLSHKTDDISQMIENMLDNQLWKKVQEHCSVLLGEVTNMGGTMYREMKQVSLLPAFVQSKSFGDTEEVPPPHYCFSPHFPSCARSYAVACCVMSIPTLMYLIFQLHCLV
jgi:hypothetical protein